MKKIIFVGLITFFLTGCGQSGGLYLPAPIKQPPTHGSTAHELQ